MRDPRPRIGIVICPPFPVLACGLACVKAPYRRLIYHFPPDGARSKRARLSPARPELCLSAVSVPVMARGPSSERALPYRVGSANCSRRKVGHAHDNSADSENVAGAREPRVHAHFIFRFKNGQGKSEHFFYP